MKSQSQTEELAKSDPAKSDIVIRPLQESDLSAADHIMRVAFGTFVGLPDPETFAGDAGYVRSRWIADPNSAFAAESGGELIGSNFATNWGSVGFFGPLTVRPDFWDRGVGRRLIEPVIELFDKWGIRHAGLFTFPHSTKHVGLYQKFGFWPRFLTAIMSKAVEPRGASGWSRFSEVPVGDRPAILNACRELTEAVYDGLDVKLEIDAVANQNLGDTVLLWNNGKLIGLGVCHSGPGTEAGTGVCRVKFGAVLPSPDAERDFGRLLEACEALAALLGASRLNAGVNTARHEAYRQMLARGFRTDIQGVVMDRPNEEGYNRADVYILDDWR
ncbi:MAG TPA: GNAT family N-acetyltransferase [Blastocatellia bacterium]|nr:GNAT family N-acetyltransferase [Blastocatellia bacterium]